MSDHKRERELEPLRELLASTTTKDDVFLRRAKKISSELKNNKAKTAASYRELLHELALAEWSDTARFETITHLLLLAVARCEFDRLGIARESFCHLTKEQRAEISNATRAFMKKLPDSCAGTIALAVMSRLMEEFKSGEDDRLIAYLREPTFRRDDYRYVLALEEGITSYVAAAAMLGGQGESSAVKNGLRRSHRRLHDDLADCRPNSLFQFSVESNYLSRYWPALALVVRWVTASGAGAVINFIVKEGEALTDQSRGFLDTIASARSLDAQGGVRMVVESVDEKAYGRPYFASSRFIAARELSKEFDCPLFFPDVEVLPQRELTAFLGKITDTNFVFGSNNGIKTIFPWRRWLATELVVGHLPESRPLIDAMAATFERCTADGSGWFVDQNVIYFLEKRCQQQGVSAMRTDKANIGLPLLQSGVTRNL